MDKAESIAGPTMYCRGCGYVLDGLDRPRCPECGREFVPDNPRTYLKQPLTKWRRKMIRRITLVVLLATMLLVMAYSLWLYQYDFRDRHARAQMASLGYIAFTNRTCPQWMMPLFLKTGIPYPRKTRGIYETNVVITDEHLAVLAKFPAVDLLYAVKSKVTDQGLKSLSASKSLMDIYLPDSLITDEGLKYLTKMEKLQQVDLQGNKITDAGLIYLNNDQLKWIHIDLSATLVTDAGLVNLKNLPNLRSLCLNDTRITDAGLAYLEQMTHLGYLEIKNTDVTAEGVARLKKNRPRLEVIQK